MSKTMCPMCSNGELRRVTGDYDTAFLDDYGNERELLVGNVTWDECSSCGERFLDDEATERIESARLQSMRRLSPAEIRGFRQSLNKTQTQMAMLLGLGAKTYSRWESGAYVQNASSDRYLRLLMANRENISILEQLADRASADAPRLDTLEEIGLHFSFLEPSEVLMDAEARFTQFLITGSVFTPNSELRPC